MITITLTEEQAELVARALDQTASRYMNLESEVRQYGTKELADRLWDAHCKFADVHELVLKAQKKG